MTFPIDQVYVSAAPDLNYGILARVETGSVWSLEDHAEVNESDSGVVDAIPRWPRRRRAGTLTYTMGEGDILETLFEVNGRSVGFLFIPPRESDYTATDQTLAPVTGTTDQYQLQVTTSTTARSVVRTIKYPINDAFLKLYVDDVLQVSGYSVNFTTGIVTFEDPVTVTPTADFHFATPVRFISDTIDVTFPQVDEDLVEHRSVSIVEVF